MGWYEILCISTAECWPDYILIWQEHDSMTALSLGLSFISNMSCDCIPTVDQV